MFFSVPKENFVFLYFSLFSIDVMPCNEAVYINQHMQHLHFLAEGQDFVRNVATSFSSYFCCVFSPFDYGQSIFFQEYVQKDHDLVSSDICRYAKTFVSEYGVRRLGFKGCIGRSGRFLRRLMHTSTHAQKGRQIKKCTCASTYRWGLLYICKLQTRETVDEDYLY